MVVINRMRVPVSFKDDWGMGSRRNELDRLEVVVRG